MIYNLLVHFAHLCNSFTVKSHVFNATITLWLFLSLGNNAPLQSNRSEKLFSPERKLLEERQQEDSSFLIFVYKNYNSNLSSFYSQHLKKLNSSSWSLVSAQSCEHMNVFNMSLWHDNIQNSTCNYIIKGGGGHDLKACRMTSLWFNANVQPHCTRRQSQTAEVLDLRILAIFFWKSAASPRCQLRMWLCGYVTRGLRRESEAPALPLPSHEIIVLFFTPHSVTPHLPLLSTSPLTHTARLPRTPSLFVTASG